MVDKIQNTLNQIGVPFQPKKQISLNTSYYKYRLPLLAGKITAAEANQELYWPVTTRDPFYVVI